MYKGRCPHPRHIPFARRKYCQIHLASLSPPRGAAIKQVLSTWVNAGWLSRDFVASLLPGVAVARAGAAATATAGAAGSTRQSGRRRRQSGGSGSGNADGGGVVLVGDSGGGTGGVKRQRTSSASTEAAVDAAANGKKGGSGGGRDGDGSGSVLIKPWVDEHPESSAFHAVNNADDAGRSPARADDGEGSGGGAKLPVPSASDLAAAVASMAKAAAATAAATGSSRGGGAGEGEGEANTVTPSPEGNQTDGRTSPADGAGARESPQELQRKALSLTLDGCGLIRRIGKAMR